MGTYIYWTKWAIICTCMVALLLWVFDDTKCPECPLAGDIKAPGTHLETSVVEIDDFLVRQTDKTFNLFMPYGLTFKESFNRAHSWAGDGHQFRWHGQWYSTKIEIEGALKE